MSLSRPFPKEPGINNAFPAQHFMKTMTRGSGSFAADYYGIFYRGVASTHIDALCHTWDEARHVERPGPEAGDHLRRGDLQVGRSTEREGILTRGVLLDVPRHRGVPSVTHDRPVHGWELEEDAWRLAHAGAHM